MCNSTNVNVIVTICRAEVSRISHLGEICDARCGSRLSEITYIRAGHIANRYTEQHNVPNDNNNNDNAIIEKCSRKCNNLDCQKLHAC